MKKTRKGFTIVELVIVIAVIAVLTAILVPTFIHLSKKANEAADHSLVTNLNKALAMREAEEGEKGKNNTMYDCVMDLDQEGYKLPQLATRSDEDLVWSQQANRFFLSTDYKEEDHGKKYNCWHIYEQMPTTEEWAIYPNEDKWTTADVTVTKVGFDAGKAEVKSVLYKGEAKGEAGNTVTIRTNGGTLSITAPNDSVTHFGKCVDVNITAIKSASYHEKGNVVEKITVSKGHVVVENGASVPQVIVSQATDAVKVTANEETKVFVDNASSSNTSVVVNSENVYVSGVADEKISGSKSAEVKKAFLVSNETELNNAAIQKKEFIQLTSSFDLTNHVIFNGFKFVLDLNGQTIGMTQSKQSFVFHKSEGIITDSLGSAKVTGYIPLHLQGNSNITIQGGTYVGSTGAMNFAKDSASNATINGGVFEAPEAEAIMVRATCSLVLNNGVVRNAGWGVTLYGNGNNGSVSFVMNGGKINAHYFAVSGNGTATYAGTDIKIHGGELEANISIYHPQNGTLLIDGNPTLKGESCLYIKSGVIKVYGGKFITTLETKVAYNYNGNGANATGDAIVIDACNYPGGNPLVEIEIKGASFVLADSTAKNVAYYSHENGAAVVIVDGKTLEPVIG